MKELKQDLAAVKRDVTDIGSDVAGRASDAAHAAADSLKSHGQDLAEKSKNAHEAVCNFARKNPTAAVLIAFGAGTLLARILPR